MKRHICVMPRSSERIHAMGETGSDRTYCGRKTSGWLVVDGTPACLKCLQAIEREIRDRRS